MKSRDVRVRLSDEGFEKLELLKQRTGAHSFAAVFRAALIALEREVELLNQRQIAEVRHIRSVRVRNNQPQK